MLGLLLAAATAHACAAPTTAAALTAQAVEAHEAFSVLDDPGFEAALQAIEAGLPCLEDALSPQQAARIHAARALDSFARDADTVPTFRAVLSADPALRFSPWLPDSHLIYIELGVAERMAPQEGRALELDDGDTMLVNGRAGDAIVLQQPNILQLQRGGAVTDSALVEGQSVPDWVVLAPEPMAPEIKRRLILGGATTLSAIAAGQLVVLSADIRDQYLSADTPRSDLGALKRQNTLAAASAAGVGLVSVGLGTALVWTW